jgi:hypothetical protein
MEGVLDRNPARIKAGGGLLTDDRPVRMGTEGGYGGG